MKGDTMGKYQWFNGYRFTRDDDTGYYLNSTLRMRMHRYVWEFHNGKIPRGCEVHHIDGDKANNAIENLQLMTRSDHAKLHAKNLTDEQRSRLRANLAERAMPKAREWHASEKGKDWHREHYRVMSDALHVKEKYRCDNCGREFEANKRTGNHFCCNACKSAWRRNSGIDDEARVCPICGSKFRANKYSKTVTCGRHCGAILTARKKKTKA